jgi:hypothetical protein
MRAFSNWEEGSASFTYEDTGFVPTAAVPLPQVGVRGILLDGGELFAGDVWLVGEGGVVLSKDGGAIRVDIVGDSQAQKRLCEQLNAYSPPWFLRTINSIAPSKYGGFTLISGLGESSDSALRIEPADNGLELVLAGSSIHATA